MCSMVESKSQRWAISVFWELLEKLVNIVNEPYTFVLFFLNYKIVNNSVQWFWYWLIMVKKQFLLTYEGVIWFILTLICLKDPMLL